MYPWQEAYDSAVLETETSLMPSRIEAAAKAIKLRVQELSQDHMGTAEERQAIDHALDGLTMLKQERL